MKRLSIIYLSIALAVCGVVRADPGKLEIGNDGIIPGDGDKPEAVWYSAKPPSANYDTANVQHYGKAGLAAAALNSLSPLGMNAPGFQTDASSKSLPASSMAWVAPFQSGYTGSEPLSTYESPGPEFGPLIITGVTTREPNSVPGSSTMLLLGFSLIGLAGYGGRKKFKR